MKRSFPILAAVAAVAAGGWFALGGTDTANSTTFSPLVSAANAQTTEAAEIDTSTIKEMTLGNADSKVQMIEYASYTCPHCAAFDHKPKAEKTAPNPALQRKAAEAAQPVTDEGLREALARLGENILNKNQS